MAAAVTGQDALAALLRLRSPSNQTGEEDPYMTAHQASIDSGAEAMAPSDAELVAEQNTSGVGEFGTPERVVRSSDSPWSLGGGGSAIRGTSVIGGDSVTLSRDALKERAIQTLKQKLGMISAQSQADIAKAVAPERIKSQTELAKTGMEQAGLAGVRASEVTKNTAEAGKSNAEADQSRSGASITNRLLGMAGQGGPASGPALGGTPMEPHVGAKGDVSWAPHTEKPVSAQGKQGLTALNEMQRLGPMVLSRLEQENPGISQDPSKYGGVMDTGQAKLKKMLYGAGMYTPNEDIGQLTQLFKVIGARPYMLGRPNQRIYEDIVSHLGDMGFSPGADYARIKQLLALAPELEQAISEVESPDYIQTVRDRKPVVPPPQSDPYGLR